MVSAPVFLQVFPESPEVKIPPPLITAANFAPLVEQAMALHAPTGTVFDVQFTPEFVEVKIPPPLTAAAKLLPSAEDATHCQFAIGALVNFHPWAYTGQDART